MSVLSTNSLNRPALSPQTGPCSRNAVSSNIPRDSRLKEAEGEKTQKKLKSAILLAEKVQSDLVRIASTSVLRTVRIVNLHEKSPVAPNAAGGDLNAVERIALKWNVIVLSENESADALARSTKKDRDAQLAQWNSLPQEKWDKICTRAKMFEKRAAREANIKLVIDDRMFILGDWWPTAKQILGNEQYAKRRKREEARNATKTNSAPVVNTNSNPVTSTPPVVNINSNSVQRASKPDDVYSRLGITRLPDVGF